MKKKYLYLLLAGLVLTACSQQASSTRTSSSSASSTSTSAKTTTNSSAPQVGLSDDAWDNGRNTVSDGKDTNSNTDPTRKLTDSAKSIVIYFSRSGSTELLANQVTNLTNSDELELTVDNTYPSNYDQTVSRANEERSSGDYPTVTTSIPDLSQYDVVYLGYPIWGMSLASPMASFLATYGDQLSGKTIIPFASNGGYGLGNSVSQIADYLPNSTILEGFSVQGNKVNEAESDLRTWLQGLGQLN